MPAARGDATSDEDVNHDDLASSEDDADFEDDGDFEEDMGYYGEYTDLEPYVYDSLPTPNIIRLMKFLEFEEYYALVRVELETYDVNQAPLYDALSYTWGPASRPITQAEVDRWERPNLDRDANEPGRFIVCNSQRVDVSVNLLSCLIQLSDSMVGQYLWVDAICINQEDIEERNLQVNLMADIYKSAQCTVVWLGLGEFEPNVSSNGLDKVLDEFQPKYKQWFEKQDTQMQSFANRIQLTDPNFLRELNLTGSAMDWVNHWRDVRRFFWRTRWFKRAWVMQEVALASRIEILYGYGKLNWNALDEIVSLHTITGLALPTIISDLSPVPDDLDTSLDGASNIFSVRLMCSGGACYDDDMRLEIERVFDATDTDEIWYAFFLMLLHQTRRQESGDPRDKIYSTWSLTRKYAPEGLKSVLAPDYNLSVENIYISTATMLCQRVPKLGMLSYVLRDENTATDLPTWVPDFRYRPVGRLMVNSYPHFDAAPRDLILDKILVEGTRLTVPAYHIDAVVEVYQPVVAMNESGDLRELLRMCLKMAIVYSYTGEDRLDVMWRIIVCDTSAVEHPAPLSETRQRFRGWILWETVVYLAALSKKDETRYKADRDEFERLFEAVQSQDLQLPSMSVVDELVAYHRGDPSQPATEELTDRYNRTHNLYRDFRTLAKWMIDGRRMFRTSKGYLGATLKSVKVSDQIWLLADAKVPFALRCAGPDYSLIGDAYLHGFMQGKKPKDSATYNFKSICIV